MLGDGIVFQSFLSNLQVFPDGIIIQVSVFIFHRYGGKTDNEGCDETAHGGTRETGLL